MVLRHLWWLLQDADCRGDVLDIMLSTVRRGCYTPEQLRTMLQTPTDSVHAWPVGLMLTCFAPIACWRRAIPCTGCQAV